MIQPIPPKLNQMLYGQQIDFAVQAKKRYPPIVGLIIIAFGCIELTMASTAFIFFIKSTIVPGSLQGLSLSTITFEKLVSSGIIFTLFPLLFVLFGLGIILLGLYLLKAEGSFIVGTEKGLHLYKQRKRKKDKHTFMERSEFSGKTSQFFKAPNQMLLLQLLSKRKVRTQNGLTRTKNNIVTITSINSFETVKELILKRIESRAEKTDTLSF